MFAGVTNRQSMRRTRCARCKSTTCTHRSSFVGGSGHWAKRGAKKAKATK